MFRNTEYVEEQSGADDSTQDALLHIQVEDDSDDLFTQQTKK